MLNTLFARASLQQKSPLDLPTEFSRSIGATLGLFLLTLLPFVAWTPNYFVADDWPVLLRNTQVSLWDVPSWFWQVRYGWYRPLFELYLLSSWRLWGLNPIGYHLCSMLLFAAVAMLVGHIGYLLTHDHRVRVLTILLFAVHGCHSTAVMWIASANELWAGLFAAATIASYICYRRATSIYWYIIAALNCLLAVMAKETALFVPLMLIGYDLLFYQQVTQKKLTIRVFAPTIFLLILVLLNLLAHPPTKAAALALHLPQLIKNLVYYLAMQLFLIPSRFSETTSTLFSLIGVLLAAISLTLLGILSIYTFTVVEACQRCAAVGYGIGLTLVALAPVIFEIWERTTFMSSMGVALCLALLFVNGWDLLSQRRKALRPVLLLALGLWLCANMTILLQRNAQWGKAGAANQTVITQLEDQLTALPPSTTVQLINLPDRFGEAYAFRNTFPSAGLLLGYQQPIGAILDVELMNPPSLQKVQLGDAAKVVQLRYENGHLVKTMH